jgi:succinate dehydrogenase / fumarate reductase cytochrome b subunit
MSLFTSSVGKKIVMAVSGLFMVLFVVVHLLGNSSIFAGPDGINAYAEKLHSLGPLVWIFRAFMLLMLVLHVSLGIMLTLENRAANPGKYAVSKKLKATFASETMIWTGVLLLAFIVYHLLQFTVRVTPDVVQGVDARGRYDVYTMVVSSFKAGSIVAVYVAAMIALFLHLSHGVQSLFQSVGLSNDRIMPRYNALAKVLATVFLVGYSAIPVSIIAGYLTR